MIVAACDACEKSIIIRSAIIEEEIVAFVFIVVFFVIFLFVFIDERQKSLRVVFFVGLFNSEEISSRWKSQTFLFRVLEFFFFVLFLFPREATIFKTTTRHLL